MEASKIGKNEGRKEFDVSDAQTENEVEVLKKIIASHPLYEVLIASHLNCLKAGLGEDGEFDIANDPWKKLLRSKFKATTSSNASELDHFMESYCMVLRKLKEAIEEPTKETKAFVNATYNQLKELNKQKNPQQPLMKKSPDDALSR